MQATLVYKFFSVTSQIYWPIVFVFSHFHSQLSLVFFKAALCSLKSHQSWFSKPIKNVGEMFLFLFSLFFFFFSTIFSSSSFSIENNRLTFVKILPFSHQSWKIRVFEAFVVSISKRFFQKLFLALYAKIYCWTFLSTKFVGKNKKWKMKLTKTISSQDFLFSFEEWF